ncbi:MAG: class I SAM-dependent methyltransferase [Candidatus Omnitrophica bacterium]|nr:class I SAM-dependent methyltransferase [Candidatus Omnitrophota bacterium]
MTIKKILDIGCGRNKIEGAIGVDIDQNSQADIIHDLNCYPYPVEANSADEVYAKHIIEHLDDPQAFLQEIYRILKPAGKAFIETPHFSSYVAYSEPGHKIFCSYFMLSNMIAHTKFKIIKQEITFYKTFRLFGIKYLADKFPRSYERFWTYIFPAENIKIVLTK